jgi:hypothetical protein
MVDRIFANGREIVNRILMWLIARGTSHGLQSSPKSGPTNGNFGEE